MARGLHVPAPPAPRPAPPRPARPRPPPAPPTRPRAGPGRGARGGGARRRRRLGDPARPSRAPSRARNVRLWAYFLLFGEARKRRESGQRSPAAAARTGGPRSPGGPPSNLGLARSGRRVPAGRPCL